MEGILSKIARRFLRLLVGGAVVAPTATSPRTRLHALLCRRAAVVGSVSVLLSVMPGMSNSVGFAQQQPGVTVRNDQTQPPVNLLRDAPPQSLKTSSGSTLSLGSQDDGYHWIFDGPGEVTVLLPDPFVGGPASNVIIEIDVAKSSGGDDNAFGLACRYGADGDGLHGYALWAGTDGTAGIGRLTPNSNGGFADQQIADGTVPAAQGYHLRAECIDSHLALSVNGTKVVEADDPVPFGTGHVALFGSTNEGEGDEFVFTNLVAKNP